MVHARFQAIYLHRWDDQFDSMEMQYMALDEWREGLAGLSVEQVKRGIDAVRVNCQWPPSIAEFVRFAKHDDRLTLACYCEFVPLPKPVQSPRVAGEAFRVMRSALAGIG